MQNWNVFSFLFFPPVHLWVCATAGGPHLIGCLGFEASLPPHSQRETIPCDLWPSPPSNRPRQHSALKTGTGKSNVLRKKKVTQPTQTHTDTPMRNERTQKDNKYRRKKNKCGHTHGHANLLHTHQDIHTWRHLRLTHKHTHIHTCRH